MSEQEQEKHDVWAIVELMGHVSLAGKVMPGELWQIDIPLDAEGIKFGTEFFSPKAVYRIRVVSEEIARAYADRAAGQIIQEYDAPIVTREEHERAMDRAREENMRLRRKVEELAYRLTAVQALPSGQDDDSA